MFSSLKLSSKTTIGKDEAKRVKNILQSLIGNNDSTEFRAPVDWKGLGLLDYGYLIKYPMDLGTVTQKFNSQSYIYVEEVLDDIQLIWDNCKTYNPQGTWFYNLAEKLQRSFKKMVKNYLPYISIIVPGSNYFDIQGNSATPKDDKKMSQISIAENDQNDQISYNEKLKFAEKLKILSPEELGTVVELIMKKCPTAIKQTNQQNAEFLVDNLDSKIYNQINALIQSFAFYEDKIVKKLKLQ